MLFCFSRWIIPPFEYYGGIVASNSEEKSQRSNDWARLQDHIHIQPNVTYIDIKCGLRAFPDGVWLSLK